MSYFKECSDGLNWIASVSFRFRPKPHDLAGRHVLLLSHAFENLSSEERSRIIDNLAPGVDMKLLALSGFIAEAAINTRNAALIKAGLILILWGGISNFRACRKPTQVMLTFFTAGISGDIHRP